MVSDIGTLKEIILHRMNDLMVLKVRPEKLVGDIQDYFENPKSGIVYSLNARKIVKSRFSKESYTDQ